MVEQGALCSISDDLLVCIHIYIFSLPDLQNRFNVVFFFLFFVICSLELINTTKLFSNKVLEFN